MHRNFFTNFATLFKTSHLFYKHRDFILNLHQQIPVLARFLGKRLARHPTARQLVLPANCLSVITDVSGFEKSNYYNKH